MPKQTKKTDTTETKKQATKVVAENVKVLEPEVKEVAQPEEAATAAPRVVRGKKEKKAPFAGKVYVTATFNNTIVTITDMSGNAIAWGSSGASGFKGARKATPYAATTAVEGVSKKVLGMGMREVEVFVKGPGPGRDSAIRALKAAGLGITMISDVTPIPHNGVRARKKRRV